MKFAYLIMAHNNPNQLIKLISLLDDKNNDIYLHIDKKFKDIEIKKIFDSVNLSTIHIYKKFNVKWAGISQTKCQMFLLNEAIKTYHDYYHLISGSDLPLHNNSVINSFFSKNKDFEFIHFESENFCKKDVCKYYNFGNNWLNTRLLSIQKKLKIFRKFYCGANWYSITHKLALDFCKNTNKLLRKVSYTLSSDEYILQTFIKKYSKEKYILYKDVTKLKDDDYESISRLIDWKRGQPYVWKEKDFNELINSGRMFARKFDEKIDNKIIEKIMEYIRNE